MTDRYKVLASTMIAGRYFTKDTVLTKSHNIPEDDMKAAVAGKFVEKEKADEAANVEMTDAAPSLTTAHHTKRVVQADNLADKKAAQEG